MLSGAGKVCSTSDRRLKRLTLHIRPSHHAPGPTTPRRVAGAAVAAAAPAAGFFQLGIIGLGAIGKDVLRLCMDDPSLVARVRVPAVLVRRPRSEHVPAAGGTTTLITSDAEAFFSAAQPRGYDAVLEVAGHDAVAAHGERVLRGGASFLVTSVGAFSAREGLLERLRAAAAASSSTAPSGRGGRLTIPSAGIGALDILSAAALGGLDRVQMVVRKDPSAWYGTIAEDDFDLGGIRTEPVTLFEGTAREGAALYPQNVNISAAVALAGVGLDRTELLIVADPTIDTHVCEVYAEGAFGKFSFKEDVEISEHRKTGKIVAMAVAKTVKQLVDPLVVGT